VTVFCCSKPGVSGFKCSKMAEQLLLTQNNHGVLTHQRLEETLKKFL